MNEARRSVWGFAPTANGDGHVANQAVGDKRGPRDPCPGRAPRRTRASRLSLSARPVLIVLLTLLAVGRADAAEVSVRAAGDRCALTWSGDERIDVSFSRTRGLLRSPVRVRVDDREFTFGGFYTVFNEEAEGYVTRSVETELEKDGARVTHVLEHPRLPSPISIRFTIRMSPATKAVRFRVDTDNGDVLHLDRLGIGNYRGAGIEPRRMFLTKLFVLDGPIEPFRLKYNYHSTRYWCFTMANGVSEMVGSDSVPRGFDFDGTTGTYDLHTYCDRAITYTFVFTGRGAQEAIGQYRAGLSIPAPGTLAQLPGRVTIMTGYPIRQRYEDFLDELAGRGARDFIWLAYAPWPGDRELVEPYGALYSVYDMYTDLFAEGPRKAEGWTPEWVRYDSPGHMKRGYWNSTRCLPELYIEMAQGKRVQGTLGCELANRGFLKTEITRFANLAIFKRDVRPTALYLDVHASLTPEHYWDSGGKHHSVSEALEHERRFFTWARDYMGGIPVYSEVDTEAFAGIMDAGIFSPWATPGTVGLKDAPGIKCASWEYYPFLDQVHRERLLNSGAGAPFALAGYQPENMALAIQFGRPQVISAYPGTSQTDIGGRMQLYYLSSAYHKMLGLSRLERVDFDGDSIHRQVATYSNGARVWSNRSAADWEVEGICLPPSGYLVRGPGGFLQCRARRNQVVEEVRAREYQYFSAERRYDFGPVITDGAVAVRSPAPGRVTFYQILKPGSVQFRLGQLPGSC
jgi:hypothetical protein